MKCVFESIVNYRSGIGILCWMMGLSGDHGRTKDEGIMDYTINYTVNTRKQYYYQKKTF